MRTSVTLAACLLTLATSAVIGAAQGQRYALIIGITGYPNFPPGNRLRFADRDAQLFYDFITSPEGGGFPDGNIRVLKNHTATRRAINEEIQWLSRRVGGEDLVYVFFSGHGVVDELGVSYFMPYDADPGSPDNAGFSSGEFVRKLRTRLSAKFLVIFVDACHAGAAFGEGLGKEGSANITPEFNRAWKDALKPQPDVLSMAFLSAAANQRSYEDPQLDGGHGLFTWYLVEGMRGAADGSIAVDGTVTAGELYRYVLDNVERHSRREFGKEQTPTVSPEFTSTFPFRVTAGGAVALAEEARRTATACYQGTLGKEYYATIHLCEEAIRVDPNNASAHFNLGWAFWQLDDAPSAKREWLVTLKLDPADPQVHANLGTALARLGDLSGGIAEARESMRLDPDGPGAGALGFILHEYAHDFAGAFAITSKWVARHPNDTSAQMDLAEQYLTTSRFAEAQARLAALLKDPSISTRHRVALGTLEIVALTGQDKMAEVVQRMRQLRGIIEPQIGEFKVGWTFAGTKQFVTTSRDANITRYRDWLLKVLMAIDTGDRDATVQLLTPSQE